MYLRLPSDVLERIEAKAKREGHPFNRILINELALFPISIGRPDWAS